MSRWTTKTEKVTVGENSVKVRGMTHDERQEMFRRSKAAKTGEGDALAVQSYVLKTGCIGEPAYSDQDISDMPAELSDAAGEKILELSGIKAEKEKKAEPTVS